MIGANDNKPIEGPRHALALELIRNMERILSCAIEDGAWIAGCSDDVKDAFELEFWHEACVHVLKQ